MPISSYATTAAGNNTGGALFPENMTANLVNDSARQMQADIRNWYQDAEWITWGDTTTYVASTQFKISGSDVTARYSVGRRVRVVGSSTGTIYGKITTSSFSTDTTVTVGFDSGSMSNETLTVSIALIKGGTSAQTIDVTGVKNAADVTGTNAFTGSNSFTTITNTGLNVLDTNASHTLGIVPGSDLTANRTLTITTGDANRAVTLSADLTVGATANVRGNNFGAPYSHIAGALLSSISGNSTTASLTITAGQATDSTNSKMLSNGSLSWAVSNGNAANGYEGGTTLPNSSTIHFYNIALATDTTWTACFASTSLTPTLPGSYTIYRRVGSLKTSGAGALLPGSSVEIGGGAQLFYLTNPLNDVSASTPATATLYTLTVPTGIVVEPIAHLSVEANSAGVIATSPQETDVAPSGTLLDFGSSAYPSGNQARLITNTSGQIRLRATSGGATGTTQLWTRGWIDFRR